MCTSGSPFFKTRPSNVRVNEGQTARFHCSGMGNPIPTLSWWTIRNGWPFELFTDGRIIISDEYLVIVNSVKSDAGVYYCMLNSSIGRNRSNEVHLDVWSKCNTIYYIVIILYISSTYTC